MRIVAGKGINEQPSSLRGLEAASKPLRLEGIEHLLRYSPMNSRICRTSAAFPAEPGDLPNGSGNSTVSPNRDILRLSTVQFQLNGLSVHGPIT